MTTSPQPAAKPHRRWHQFSLRTLLTGTAVVAAILAVGLRWIAPAQRQRAAVKMVEELGGTVAYADVSADASWAFRNLRHWLLQDYGLDVKAVDLSYLGYCDTGLVRIHQGSETVISDELLVALQSFRGLRKIRLDGALLNDRLVDLLAQFDHLEELSVADTDFSDANLGMLCRLPRLRCLNVSETEITDAGLNLLRKLPGLQSVDLRRTDVTTDGFMDLQEQLPDCNIEWP